MPTWRGSVVALMAVLFYVAGRLFGTYELYLFALALGFLVLGLWILILVSSRFVEVEVHLGPAQTVAGEQLELEVSQRNRAYLPMLGWTIILDLAPLGHSKLAAAHTVVWPRSVCKTRRLSEPVWRGVYDLGSAACELSDPLGLAGIRSRPGRPFHVVVVPRLPELETLQAIKGLQSGTVGLVGGARGEAEFRGLRAHQPGDPLNRIHWRSTARTGILMVRELENTPQANLLVVLDGTLGAQAGEYPDDSFEKQVQLAGALADGALRSGQPVAVLLHGAEDEFQIIEPTPAGRQRLLRALAGVRPQARRPVGDAIVRATTHGLRASTVVVVSCAHDRGLANTVKRLVQSQITVVLVHVLLSSYAGLAHPTPEESLFQTEVRLAGAKILAVGKGQ